MKLPRREPAPSDEVTDDLFSADHGSSREGVFGALGIYLISHQTVLRGIDFIEEEIPEAREIGFFEPALEDGVLDADAEVLTNTGDAGEALWAGDVVSEERKHFFFSGWGRGVGDEGEGVEEPRGHGRGEGCGISLRVSRPGALIPVDWRGRDAMKRRVGRRQHPPPFLQNPQRSVHEEGLEFFGEVEGGFEEDRLDFELLAEGGAVAHVFRHELTFHAAFVLEEEAGAAFGVQIDAAVGGFEVFGLEDLVAEAVEGERFGKDGAEGLHEIEREGPAAVFGDVEEAGSGIEAMGMEEGGDLVVKESGAEGEAGVDGIVRGAAGAGSKGNSTGRKVAQISKYRAAAAPSQPRSSSTLWHRVAARSMASSRPRPAPRSVLRLAAMRCRTRRWL